MRRAFEIVFRVINTLLGLLFVLVGLIWIGQGLHIGPAAIMRGFMVSDKRWAIYGALLALGGVGEVVWTNTRRS